MQLYHAGTDRPSVRLSWLVLHGILIPACCKRLYSSSLDRYPIWACHTVSCLAGSPHHVFVYIAWPFLYGFLVFTRHLSWKSKYDILNLFSLLFSSSFEIFKKYIQVYLKQLETIYQKIMKAAFVAMKSDITVYYRNSLKEITNFLFWSPNYIEFTCYFRSSRKCPMQT